MGDTHLLEAPGLFVSDGIQLSGKNIRNGPYPLITPIHTATRKGEQNPNVLIFLNRVTGPQFITRTAG